MQSNKKSPNADLISAMPEIRDIAAYHLERLARARRLTYQLFAAAMLKDAGERIRPYLHDIWDAVTGVARLNKKV